MASEPTSAVRESACVTRYEPEALTIETDAASPGLLAVSEVYSGGWQATVDGEDMEVLPTNHALRGVPIPAGKHRIELRYGPRSLRLGIPISAVSSVRFRRHAPVGARALGRDPARGRQRIGRSVALSCRVVAISRLPGSAGESGPTCELRRRRSDLRAHGGAVDRN